MRLITNIFEYCSKNVPKWNTISISGYHIREAGATAAQEVAFTLADGIAYVEAALAAGMDVDTFAGRLSFFFNAHNNLLEEVAKFRAARRLWAKIMRERFHGNDRSCMLRFHTQTGGSTLTAQQPDNNIVRVAIQTLAAVMGGTQSLHTNSRDEALALPTEDSVRIALRTQQIVAYESGVADTIDPLAGSYYVESLTDKIQEIAEEYIAKIDAMGGAVKAVEEGYIQKEIAESSYAYQKRVEAGEQIVVGMNKFKIQEKKVEGLLRVDASVGENQIQKLRAIKAARNNDAVKKSLAALGEAAKTDANLMPYILDAARVYATEGEICGELRKVFGEYRPVEVL
jgi:methylmalonyl-CoA mutase N-terminal domain/subunit